MSLISKASRQRGLSLLEMIVVLTMVSMLSVVLFQGYGYLLGNYQRVQDRHFSGFDEVLRDTWLRALWQGLMPFQEESRQFVGEPQGMQGSSFSPILSTSGVSRQFALFITTQGQRRKLVYQEQYGDEVTLASWERGQRISFAYLDKQGDWAANWSKGDGSEQLPEAVRMQVVGSDPESDRQVTSRVVVRKIEDVPLTDVLYGRQ